MRNIRLISMVSIILITSSCEKENQGNLSIDKVTGYVQKGPYLNGTAITISELSGALDPSGRTFSTQILDNKGTFEINNINLSSEFVELKADGFYFDEISNENSIAQLTLFALSDIKDKTTLNVNVLSSLEKGRVGFLISGGSTFPNAKKQAQAEILKIFGIEKADINESELLDISKEGDDNAILLAISVILQGYRTVGELAELIANMSTDIREDGELNSPVLGTDLINHAHFLNLLKIRENLEYRYEEMGINASIPDFEKYVKLFQDSSDFEFTGLIEYPEYSDYGENILFNGKSSFETGHQYSLAANLPHGVSLKIILKGGSWYFQVAPSGPVNWKVSQYDFENRSQIFTSLEPGKKCDLIIHFENSYWNDSIVPSVSDSILVEYYENLVEVPTKTKVIHLE